MLKNPLNGIIILDEKSRKGIEEYVIWKNLKILGNARCIQVKFEYVILLKNVQKIHTKIFNIQKKPGFSRTKNPFFLGKLRVKMRESY